ncbi:MAG: hypothetical protein ACLVKA_03285 [Collinsella aerofaciens]
MDLGHYERFIDENLTRDSNFTTGAIYKSLIAREHRVIFGRYRTVIPRHQCIKDKFRRIEQTETDVVITSWAARSATSVAAVCRSHPPVPQEAGPGTSLHPCRSFPVSPPPEVKTKPTQHSVKGSAAWYQPDIIVLRSDHHIDDAIRGKIASFCDVGRLRLYQRDCAALMFRSCLPSRTLTCALRAWSGSA